MKALIFLLAFAGMASAAEPELVGAYRWTEPLSGFGGFSGFDFRKPGQEFVAITDRGKILQGRLQRQDGRITGVDVASFEFLKDRSNKPLSDYHSNAEGLDITRDGNIYLTFEGNHRMRRYGADGTYLEAIPSPGAFAEFQSNSGLEVLASDATGTLFTLPERSGHLERPFPVFRFRNGAWDQPFSLTRRGRFLPVGADIGPDGRFYLLERDFLWHSGFASRIRRFSIGETGLRDEETLLETGFGAHDNLEAIAVWRDDAGDLRLTLLSDDNFQFLQITEFVEYRLPPD